MTKEHLEGRAEALGEVIATLDERLAKGCGMWAYELRQELARVKSNCERKAEKSTPDYERRKAYDEGYNNGYGNGHDRGQAEGQVIGYANGLAQGKIDGDWTGYARGYAVGLAQGKIDGDWTGYARGHAVGHDRGYKACALDHEIEIVEP